MISKTSKNTAGVVGLGSAKYQEQEKSDHGSRLCRIYGIEISIDQAPHCWQDWMVMPYKLIGRQRKSRVLIIRQGLGLDDDISKEEILLGSLPPYPGIKTSLHSQFRQDERGDFIIPRTSVYQIYIESGKTLPSSEVLHKLLMHAQRQEQKEGLVGAENSESPVKREETEPSSSAWKNCVVSKAHVSCVKSDEPYHASSYKDSDDTSKEEFSERSSEGSGQGIGDEPGERCSKESDEGYGEEPSERSDEEPGEASEDEPSEGYGEGSSERSDEEPGEASEDEPNEEYGEDSSERSDEELGEASEDESDEELNEASDNSESLDSAIGRDSMETEYDDMEHFVEEEHTIIKSEFPNEETGYQGKVVKTIKGFDTAGRPYVVVRRFAYFLGCQLKAKIEDHGGLHYFISPFSGGPVVIKA